MRLAKLPNVADLLPDIPLVEDAQQAHTQGVELLLGRFPQGLGLARPNQTKTPLVVDFLGGKQGFRSSAERYRHELVVKACQASSAAPGQILDGTAGLGRDGFILACAGASVTLLEREPVLAAMLADGIERLAHVQPQLAERLRLQQADTQTWLDLDDNEFDTVYLDPMFPARQKSAAIKKELAFIQLLAPTPTAEQESGLWQSAMARASKRVVVKRPAKAPFFAEQKPSHQIQGKAIRFDVYVSQ